MTTRAERIRAILEAQDKPKDNTNKQAYGAVYPFWNLEHGSNSVVRFLPDGDTSNPLPWVETQQINLTFSGIVGEEPKYVNLKVPCMEMFNKSDPILGRIRKEKWFDSPDEDVKKMASKYWKKYSYLMQGFIVEDGLGEEDKPENPIRRFVMGKQIFTPIRNGYADPEFEDAPDSETDGIDFTIKCEPNGQWNNYASSAFKRKSRSLNETELAAIEQYGLSDLKEFRPKEPTEAESATLYEMFEASLNGEMYDPARWGYLPWRPRGVDSNNTQSTASKPATTTPKAAEVNTPAPAGDAASQAQAILDMIKKNQ